MTERVADNLYMPPRYTGHWYNFSSLSLPASPRSEVGDSLAKERALYSVHCVVLAKLFIQRCFLNSYMGT